MNGNKVIRRTTINGIDYTIEAIVGDYWQDNGDGTESLINCFEVYIINEENGETEPYCRCGSSFDGIENAIDYLKRGDEEEN